MKTFVPKVFSIPYRSLKRTDPSKSCIPNFAGLHTLPLLYQRKVNKHSKISLNSTFKITRIEKVVFKIRLKNLKHGSFSWDYTITLSSQYLLEDIPNLKFWISSRMVSLERSFLMIQEKYRDCPSEYNRSRNINQMTSCV